MINTKTRPLIQLVVHVAACFIAIQFIWELDGSKIFSFIVSDVMQVVCKNVTHR